MDTSKALAITLWRLANTTTFREVGQQFNERRQTVLRVCVRMMRIIQRVHQRVMRLPSTAQEWQTARAQWAPSARFANTVGAVDGSHIRLLFPPRFNRKFYQNRKKFPSTVLQAVVNHRHLFLDIVVGAEGSHHDAMVWTRSNASTVIAASIPPHHYIIGDSAYPAQPYLITPHKNVQNNAQQLAFNKALSSTRVSVELTFGKSKCRWRCLNGVRCRDMDYADLSVWTCCLLHNWLLLHNDDVLMEWMATQSKVQEAQLLAQRQLQALPAPDEEPPSLLELYRQHNQQPQAQGPAPPQQPAVAGPHVHVQLDAQHQPLFDQFFASGPASLTNPERTRVGLHLREQITATY
jgi:hypothetical protein